MAENSGFRSRIKGQIVLLLKSNLLQGNQLETNKCKKGSVTGQQNNEIQQIILEYNNYRI